MQGQRSPKANNKSLGFVKELKTKAISRYVKKTIPPSLKRLLLNSQACRKPSVKPYNQHEPCKACEQGGLLAPHWPHPRGYHSLEKGFPHPTYILQSTPKHLAAPATAEEPAATAGTSARGSALQMDTAEEKLLT